MHCRSYQDASDFYNILLLLGTVISSVRPSRGRDIVLCKKKRSSVLLGFSRNGANELSPPPPSPTPVRAAEDFCRHARLLRTICGVP